MSFFSRMFGRKPKWVPPQGDGRTHGDWKAGDLAVCIGSGPWFRLQDGQLTANPPSRGKIYRVSGVLMARGFHLLFLEELHPSDSWDAAYFRKIARAEDGPCEEEFVTLLRRMRPKVSA